MNNNDQFFSKTVIGHPAALFVLFFTEMWERFSYYGMRAILVIFLTGAILGDNPGWGWSSSAALSLLGTYAMFAYLAPLAGGWLGDKKIGYRNSVVIGALLMTLGHASMAVETPTFLYIGISLLVIGTGFFKPNITSIISKMYEGRDDKKDGAFNIFYMGVNAGAFLGIMLCGWVGEKVGWSFGFGLAGIFMLLGMIQFYFAQPLFGKIGDPPLKSDEKLIIKKATKEKLNPFLPIDILLIITFVISALIFIINDPLSKIGGIDILNFTYFGMENSLFFALIAFIAFGAPAISNHSDRWQTEWDTENLSSLLPASALMFVAFTGYGRIATLGEEVAEPRRTIPRAIITTLVITTLLYIGVAWIALANAGHDFDSLSVIRVPPS